MPLSSSLFERSVSAPPIPKGLPLVIALTGFTDAGGALSRTIEYFRDELDPTPVAVFANDVLLDYRARRPVIAFDQDHLTEYRPPRLELSLAHDTLGSPFLLLAGYEPDFAWEAFASSVLAFAVEHGVSTVTWVHAIPMPVPHTRPIGTTVSGTRSDLAEAHSVWKPTTQVPATVGHLLEYRFAEQGAAVAGFVLLVPHYLGDTEYPASSMAALDAVTVATGLVFDGDALRDENREYLQKVDEQVAGSEELSRMVENLEERYDAYMAGSTQATPIIHTGDLPSADELAAELERFLANRPPTDDDHFGA
ncbi:PAC2 family protein [Microbacterium sp. SSW1-59]|uniref:proteasome assembly chaperone family protein n=1 Tax=Microbacterium xanthum TaxID=3079794 RepID=UPI002AD529E0|nr:PAC2 family protein [Microbacterium sp. SSW1-59]MDZ8202363.1 PAC2 family protein [Microbacterium sp. SSW1-59]